jgi:hypothetical protein
MLPPGDIRNCLVALSQDEALLSRLFQYRFSHGDLDGHSFGNLFLAALTGITGDFAQAVQVSSQILATRGRIYPCTTANATISARMDDGSTVHGETNITASHRSIAELMLSPADASPLPEALEAIAAADLITLGPGSLYTSLITNLLVREIPEAIGRSQRHPRLHLQPHDAGQRVPRPHRLPAHRKNPRPRRHPDLRLRPHQHRPIGPSTSTATPAKARPPSSPTSNASAPSASSPSPATSSTKAKSSATATTSLRKPSCNWPCTRASAVPHSFGPYIRSPPCSGIFILRRSRRIR